MQLISWPQDVWGWISHGCFIWAVRTVLHRARPMLMRQVNIDADPRAGGGILLELYVRYATQHPRNITRSCYSALSR